MCSINLPLVSNNLNLKLPVYVSPFLDCGAWRTDALHISWEGLDSFVLFPVALIPEAIQDDHLWVQIHHDCTRVAKDSSGDLKDDHLQVQFHHDCIMMVMVNVLVLGPGRSIHKPPSEASLW